MSAPYQVCGAFSLLTFALTEDICEIALHRSIGGIAEGQQIAVCVREDDVGIILLHQASVSTFGEIKHHAVLLTDIFHKPDICCSADLLANGVHPFHEIGIGDLQCCGLLPAGAVYRSEG